MDPLQRQRHVRSDRALSKERTLTVREPELNENEPRCPHHARTVSDPAAGETFTGRAQLTRR